MLLRNCSLTLLVKESCLDPTFPLNAQKHMVDTLANTLVLGMAREGTPVAQAVKNLPSMQETWVRSLGLEDILAKGTATHSHILAWRIPWTEKLGGLQSMGSQSVRHN